MLYYETIDSPTLELLRKLLAIPAFTDLRLVGGTSLALQYGHRKSIDIDLFGSIDLDGDTLSSILSTTGEIKRLNNQANIHLYTINGIKVDIVHYPYPWIDTLNIQDQLRLASDKDIGAMKLAAITGRGTKKDFIDLYELLQRYSLSDLVGFYEQKYHDGSVFLVLKSLVYFEDANNEIDPFLLRDYSWEEVKEHIRKVHVQYVKNIF